MTVFVVAAAALLVVVALAALRGARRRTAELEATLHASLERRLGGELIVTDRSLRLAEGAYRIPRARLLQAARRRAGHETVVAAAAALLRCPLRPLPGALNLKIHGTRVKLHFVNPAVFDLMATEPRLARRPEAVLGLAATYRIDGRADQCVSEDHLREQAIDTTDLHGIALAVLRQEFDDRMIDRLIGGSRERVESRDGTAAALLLVLPDLLPPGKKIAAGLDGADLLDLRPWPETGDPSSAGLALSIDDRGWRVL